MTVILALLGAAIGATVTLALTLVRERAKEAPPTWLELKRRRQLMFHLDDESTVRGVVIEVSEEGVLLGAVEYLGEKSVQLGGEVWLDRRRILFVQAPPMEARR